MHQMLTVKQVADRLALSIDQVYRLKKKIGYAQLGGAIRFREADVDLFIASRMVKEPERAPSRPRRPPKLKHLRVPEWNAS